MQDLTLPEEIRASLKKPFGRLIKGDGPHTVQKVKELLTGNERVIVVGDASYEIVLGAGIKPHLAILDFKVKRKPYKKHPANITADNPAGMITAQLWKAIEDHLEKGGIIGVEGEEDLAVIPVVLEADFDDIILYGQPDEGMVYIKVDEDIKERIAMLLKIMESLQE